MTGRSRRSGQAGDPDGRYLAYLLRHDPAAAGLVLDDAGWVEVDALVAGSTAVGRPLERAAVERVVAADAKGRFELRHGRIRAVQGHSVEVDLGLDPVVPPDVLFHGTVERFLERILVEGLLPGSRRHVHLSPDVHTARQVGGRRGRPIVLQVDAAGAHAAGHPFYRAVNGVWLTDRVPAEHLTRTF